MVDLVSDHVLHVFAGAGEVGVSRSWLVGESFEK